MITTGAVKYWLLLLDVNTHLTNESRIFNQEWWHYDGEYIDNDLNCFDISTCFLRHSCLFNSYTSIWCIATVPTISWSFRLYKISNTTLWYLFASVGCSFEAWFSVQYVAYGLYFCVTIMMQTTLHCFYTSIKYVIA